MTPIRVLVIDDSAVMREIVTAIVNQQNDMQVVGYGDDPLIAREQIKALDPDVVTLDVEMPRMDGITFLEKLMRLRPMPVIMISALTEANADVTLRALELGAIDCIAKPGAFEGGDLQRFGSEIVEKIRFGAALKQRLAMRISSPPTHSFTTSAAIHAGRQAEQHVICIGASTGGIEAVKQILVQLPPACPPVLIVQHLPEIFTRAFAERMDKLCAIRVKEAQSNDILSPGHAYVAPGHSHMTLAESERHLVIRLNRKAPINRHRPSVDALFHSAASIVGAHGIGILLTGMGRDGADGLLAMRAAGAFTVAQDEQSSVIFGMPRSAIEIGAAGKVLPLQSIAGEIRNYLGG